MDQALLSEIEPYINRNLFSDHFLRKLLPDDESWAVDEDKVRLTMQATLNLYAPRKEELPHLNEAQLEQEFVRPLLESLGHVFEVQPSLPTSEGVRRPDYAFFATREEKRQAGKHRGKLDYFKKAIAIGDAKPWGRPLDKRQRGGTDKFDTLSPSWQIDYYLRTSEVPWAILTDGRFWRLYNRETSFRLDVYYEIDLPQILDARDIEAFKYFHLFFRREAFLPVEEKECFLDRVYKGSLEYAKAVGEDLKENVYSALRLLAQGFLDYPDNRLDPERDLEKVHQNALIYLYRLLFICYAEDRLLLPRNNAIYHDTYGLVSIEREVGAKIDRKEHLSPVHTRYSDHLSALFKLINEGSEKLGIDRQTMDVPPYDGGLFDPEKHPFLKDYKVADRYLAPVIDLLSRSESRNGSGRAFVDYSSMDVRHLGSIYEGLLEYRLRAADEEMVAIRKRGRENWVPAKENEGKKLVDRVKSGELYLVTDRGERKATGSFYTPDYIVKYIVENTLGPLIKEKMKEQNPIEGILSLKVLDPATGSGHFLVEATDRLAHALIEALGGSPNAEDDIRWARREVVERCIYGVDLNPLAVELAKLSLWLHTVAEGKPLNFLDHHLRCGNSLVGARFEQLGNLPVRQKGKSVPQEQMALFDESAFTREVSLAVGGLISIQDLASDRVEHIRQKERIFQELMEVHLKRWRQIADLWVSSYFGNEMAPNVYADLVQRVRTGEGMLPAVQAQSYLDYADALWQKTRFFHWELEFPEVFFDQDGQQKENPGFDAVVGNPPYRTLALGRGQQAADESELGFLRTAFPDAAEYKTNLFPMFLEQGAALAKRHGCVCLIMPETLLTNYFFKKLRHRLLEEFAIRSILDVDEKVFADAEIGGNIVMAVCREKPSKQQYVRALELDDQREITALGDIRQLDFLEMPDYRFLIRVRSLRLLQKIRGRNPVLGDVAILYNGIKTGDNRRFLSTEKSHPLHREVLRGRDTDRYGLHFGNVYVLFDKERLWSNTNEEMFEAEEKLIVRQTGDRLVGAYDAEQHYTMDTTHLIIPHRGPDVETLRAQYILALYNSTLLNWYYSQIVPELGRAFAEVKIVNIRKLPIRRIAFTTPADERERRVAEAQALCAVGDQGAVLALTESCLRSEPNQADVIRDVLVCLAGQMTEMNKEKRAEAKGFLDWLAGYTGLPIEEWRLKTIVKAYWEHGWDEIRRALRQNRKAIEQASGRNVEGREALEAIQGEFEQSVARLKPLLQRIVSTDRLIDLIVYRLYGLTEEEVAIVEGE